MNARDGEWVQIGCKGWRMTNGFGMGGRDDAQVLLELGLNVLEHRQRRQRTVRLLPAVRPEPHSLKPHIAPSTSHIARTQIHRTIAQSHNRTPKVEHDKTEHTSNPHFSYTCHATIRSLSPRHHTLRQIEHSAVTETAPSGRKFTSQTLEPIDHSSRLRELSIGQRIMLWSLGRTAVNIPRRPSC